MTAVTSATPGVLAVPGASEELVERLSDGLERVERLEAEKKDLAEQQKEIMASMMGPACRTTEVSVRLIMIDMTRKATR